LKACRAEPGHRGFYRDLRGVKVVWSSVECVRWRPGVPGMSENIGVRSIVGRFSSIDRCFISKTVWRAGNVCASADWMERNFFRRVEIAFQLKVTRTSEADLQRPGLCMRDKKPRPGLLRPDGSYEEGQAAPQERAVSAQKNG